MLQNDQWRLLTTLTGFFGQAFNTTKIFQLIRNGTLRAFHQELFGRW